jgi:hypothetical protein
MNRNSLIATISLAVVVITMMASNQLSIYASPTTEDDGWTEGDYEGSPEEQEEQAQEDWEDAGRPGDDDNDNNDNDDDNEDDGEQIFTCSDGSTVTGNEECPSTGPNPYCDTPEGKAATICHDRFDTDENGIATCNDGTYKADPKDCKDATKKPLPYCDTPAGKAASSCHDRLDYDDVTGLAPYNDGTQKADYHDCKDASTSGKKTESRNDDNNFNPNNDNNDNSNSDNIPECKRDVLQECKLSGNTGLLCGVEDLMQSGNYNPNVIGDGHACHDVYIGTYNQLHACKDGTYAVSCGSIGVLPGIP